MHWCYLLQGPQWIPAMMLNGPPWLNKGSHYFLTASTTVFKPKKKLLQPLFGKELQFNNCIIFSSGIVNEQNRGIPCLRHITKNSLIYDGEEND